MDQEKQKEMKDRVIGKLREIVFKIEKEESELDGIVIGLILNKECISIMEFNKSAYFVIQGILDHIKMSNYRMYQDNLNQIESLKSKDIYNGE